MRIAKDKERIAKDKEINEIKSANLIELKAMQLKIRSLTESKAKDIKPVPKMYVCVRVCVCMCMCVRVCVCVCLSY